jgi:hypothetical protein
MNVDRTTNFLWNVVRQLNFMWLSVKKTAGECRKSRKIGEAKNLSFVFSQ